MATYTLLVNPEDVGATAEPGLSVLIELWDGTNDVPVVEAYQVSTNQPIALSLRTVTGATGTVSPALIPNADITPSNSCYRVTIADGFEAIIQKDTNNAQTIRGALVTNPGALGPVTGATGTGITWRGAWSAGTYVLNDMVSYLGSTWVANKTTTHTPPATSVLTDADWDLAAAKGDSGATGAAGLTSRGAWSSSTAYVAGDWVTLSGSSYACVLGHTNQTPPNATYWAVLASKGDTGTAGSTILNGSGAPSSGTGANGDFYYDPTAKIMYGPKAAGAWPSGVSLAGSNGTNGSFATALTIVNDATTGSTAYTLATADAGKMRRMTGASAATMLIPTNASDAIPVGSVFFFSQAGAGQLTFTAVTPGTTTVNATPTVKTRAQYSQAQALKVATDTWAVSGDLAAS